MRAEAANTIELAKPPNGFFATIGWQMLRRPLPEELEEAKSEFFAADAMLALNCNRAGQCIVQEALAAHNDQRKLKAIPAR